MPFLDMDLTSKINQIVLILYFVLILAILTKKEYTIGGFMLFIFGLFLLFNGINFYLCLVLLIIASMIIATTEDGH